MPIYAILVRIFGRWVDVFAVIGLIILYYYNLLLYDVFIYCLKFLMFLYLYKLYYWIFFRQYSSGEKMGLVFIWDFERMYPKKYFIKYDLYKYVPLMFILMPWNLVWYLIIKLAVLNKIIQVWINGNKDIFFKKFFNIDIRPMFDKYLITYYNSYVCKFIKFFIYDPFFRILVLPTIIRESIIKSRLLSILRARLFMFVFISILVVNNISLFSYFSYYQIIIMIYIYLLLIWPILIKFFNIEKVIYYNVEFNYGTPLNMYNVFCVILYNSVSLNLLSYFTLYVNKYIKRNYFIGGFFISNWNIKLLSNYGKVSINGFEYDYNMLFWRYEKTYTSLNCFHNFISSDLYTLYMYLYLSNNYKLKIFTKEESEEITRVFSLYLKYWMFCALDAYMFNLIFIDQDLNVMDCLFNKDFVYIFNNDNFIANKNRILSLFYEKNFVLSYEDIPEIFIPIEAYIERYKISMFFKSFDILNLNNDLCYNYVKFFNIWKLSLIDENISETISEENNKLLNEFILLHYLYVVNIREGENNYINMYINMYADLITKNLYNYNRIVSYKDLINFFRSY